MEGLDGQLKVKGGFGNGNQHNSQGVCIHAFVLRWNGGNWDDHDHIALVHAGIWPGLSGGRAAGYIR